MTEKIFNVLFICTGSSSRCIMAEAMLNTLRRGKFRAYSAGSHPTGTVNSFAIEQVKKLNYPMANLRNKSWDEFANPDAPKMDFIITVCDNAAREICPRWPGHPITANWGFEDPAAVEGSDEEKRAAFELIFKQILKKIRGFSELNIETMDYTAIQQSIKKIGEEAV